MRWERTELRAMTIILLSVNAIYLAVGEHPLKTEGDIREDHIQISQYIDQYMRLYV